MALDGFDRSDVENAIFHGFVEKKCLAIPGERGIE